MTNDLESYLTMTIISKRSDDGFTNTTSRVEVKGSQRVLLSGLCAGLRRALKTLEYPDELFIAAYLTQEELDGSSMTIDTGAINEAIENLKEGEDDA